MDATQTDKPSPNRTGLGVGTIASSSAAPYGFTISLWSCGALLIHWHSNPTVWEVFLFAAGTVAGFGLIGLIAHRRMWAAETLPTGSLRVLAGVLHWFAVGLAVGTVALVAMIPSWVAWPLGSFLGTTIYLVVAGLELGLIAGRNGDT
jgi:hypothetical protein